MIPLSSIVQWSETAPWIGNKNIEQDLLICRALCEIYNDGYLSEHLAFRGGTALGKLYLSPQPRYSEDIDLVQVCSEPIKETIMRLQSVLSFLGHAAVKPKKYNNTLLFKVQPTEMGVGEIRLKVEINCKEHFSIFPAVRIPFSVSNVWYSGHCKILTYELEELAGTKLRALYQRRKGRDLFDLAQILTQFPDLDLDKVILSYQKYLTFTASHLPTYKEFQLNLAGKLQDHEFLADTDAILSPNTRYDPQAASELVQSKLFSRMSIQGENARSGRA